MKNMSISLNNLNKHGMKLLNFLRAHTRTDDDAITVNEKKFKGILRKIKIAELFEGKRIICISGLQGQGKSTMLRNMYDAGQETEVPKFRTNLARGEKFPIFVTESNIDRVIYKRKYYTISANGDYVLADEIIEDYEKFEAIACNGDDDTVLLKIEAPYLYLKDDGATGFLLLPGFEERKDKLSFETKEETYWKDLLNFCAACADVNLFVTQYTMFANSEINAISEKFNGMGLKENTVFVISHSDELSINAKDEVRLNCEKIFGVGNMADVVFIDNIPAKNPKNSWVNEILELISKNKMTQDAIEAKRANYLSHLILEDLTDFSYDLKDTVDELAIADNKDSSELYHYEKVIDNAWKKIKRHYSKQIKDCLNEASQHCIDRLEWLCGENGPEEYQKGWLTKLRQKAFGVSRNDHICYRNLIKDALKDENGVSWVARANQKALRAGKDAYVDNINALCLPQPSDNANGKSSPMKCDFYLDANASRNIAMLMNTDRQGRFEKGLDESLGILMNLVFWQFQGNVNEFVSNHKSLLSAAEFNQTEAEIDFAKSVKGFKADFATGASIFGITYDAAVDGKIDTFKAIGDLFHISEGAVCGAVALCAVGYIAANFIKGATKAELEEHLYAERVLRDACNRVEEEYLSQAEYVYETFKEYAIERLSAVMGLGSNSSDVANAKFFLKCVNEDIDSISRSLSEESKNVRLLR